MYEKVFNLESRPFVSAPFVKHYYATQSMSHTLAQTQLCIDRAAGPVVVIGGAGTGKSLLLTMLAEKYASQFNVVNLACARLAQRSDLLQNILFELQQPYRDMTEGELRLALIDYLKPSSLCPNGVLLLVDEAQVLDASLLDEVRLITNFVRDGQPRVRLIMAGSQELENSLTNPKLESFNQRIAARCYLSNLSYQETVGYVWTHIDRAGGRGEELVPENTIRVLFEVTDGCPRLINQVCDQALMLAAVNNHSLLTEQCLQEAWRDVQNIPGAWDHDKVAPPSENAATESAEQQWTVLEFGQLDDESSAGEINAFEIATDEDQLQVALANPANEGLSEQSAMRVDDANAGSDPWVDADDISAPLLGQIAEFAQRYGAPESLAAEDEIVEPLAEQIAEFQERYGAGISGEDPAAGEASDAHDDIAIPLEAKVAELNLRSQTVDSSIGNDVFIVPEDYDQDPEDVDFDSDDNFGQHELATDSIQFGHPTTAHSDGGFDSFPNPFDESFEEEELLVDNFLPMVAEQNRNSLLVSSSDLESIHPPQRHISLAELQADLLGENTGTAEAATFDLHSANLANSRTPQRAEPHAEATGPAETRSAAASPDLERFDVVNELPNTTDESGYFEPVEPALGENKSKLPSSAVDVTAPDFIEKRKAEILLSLSEDGQSGEPSYQDVVQAIEGRRSDMSMINQFPLVSDKFDDAADPESILLELRNQHHEFNQAFLAEFHDEQDADETQGSALAIEYPISEHEGYHRDDDGMPKDDRDMIIVSRADRLTSRKSPDEVPDELMPRNASTGRAERMEYQQLFDQLRKVPKEDD